jgi:2-polyprenyl-3-methyl-5-hydroxy-6-metoxy-1,4-benzoquinol methylase
MRDIFANLKLFDIDLYKLRSRNFHADMIADREDIFPEFADCLRKESDFVCPLCGGTHKKPYLAWRGYALYECETCLAVSPNIDIVKVLARDLHAKPLVADDIKREILATYEYRKKTFATERVAYLRGLIDDFGGKGESILDIGCGPGYFLSHLKDIGIRARGLEVNPFCVRFCTETGLNVADARLEDEPDESYSLITMFDVLEHLDRPIEFFQTAARKLKPGGHLFAYTPNIHSMSSHLMGGEHNNLAVFNHLCFYDRFSLDFLTKKSGFEVVHCAYYGLDVMDYLAMMEAQDEYPYFERLRKMVAPLQAMVDAQGFGNSMRILFKRT